MSSRHIGGGGRGPEVPQILKTALFIGAGLVLVSMLFTLGVLGIAVALVIGVAVMLWSAARNSRLAKSFLNTKVGRDMQRRMDVAKAERRAGREATMMQHEERIKHAMRTGDHSAAPRVMEMMIPLMRHVGETLREQNAKVNQALQQLEDEVSTLMDGNRHAQSALGDLHGMNATDAEIQGDADEYVMRVSYHVLGSHGQGEVRVLADGFEDERSNMNLTLKSAVLVLQGGEEIPLLKKKRVIVDV